MEQQRLVISDITIGQPLPWDVYAAGRQLLMRQGQVIETIHQAQILIERGLYVDAHHIDLAARAARTEERVKVIEIPSVLRLVNMAGKRLERILYGLNGESDAPAKILEVTKAISYAATINPDIALASIMLNQEAASYAVRHCIDTAILALLVARAMHKPVEETENILAAALTMNIGMLRQHDQFENKQEALTEKERELIHRHPDESVALLKQAGVTNPDWLSYVQLHHESEDGSGYPRGKEITALPQNVKILALADHFCAAISDRKYRKTLTPPAALRDVFVAGGKAGDPLLAAYFIKELGAYPPGTFVRLQNGEIGVVTGKGASHTMPVVHAMIGPRGAPLSFPIKRDTSKQQLFGIREPLQVGEAQLRFSMQQIWGAEAAL